MSLFFRATIARMSVARDLRRVTSEAEGGEAGATTPQQFEEFLRAERMHWQGLVIESGVSKVL
jgi:hypothetical protein